MNKLCSSISSKDYQIKQSEITKTGTYPVISQSVNYVEGYSDNGNKLLNVTSPLIIFGDHTRIVKYVDFDFIVGADGVKILQPWIEPRFFYYLTLYVASMIKDRGYGRHFGYLSEYIIPVPPIEEQERIVGAIQQYYHILDNIIANL